MAKYKGNWAVEGMKRRRRQLASNLENQKQVLKEIQEDIDTLDRAMQVCGFSGNPKELTGRRRYRQMFARG